MQKRHLILVAIFILAFASVLPAAASFQSAPSQDGTNQVVGEVIRIGTDAAYPPFEEIDEDGNFIGFDIELMDAIAEDAGSLLNTSMLHLIPSLPHCPKANSML